MRKPVSKETGEDRAAVTNIFSVRLVFVYKNRSALVVKNFAIKNIFLVKNFLTTPHSPSFALVLRSETLPSSPRLGTVVSAPLRKCYPALSH